jgi:membrane-associated phospholipid phosphatase
MKKSNPRDHSAVVTIGGIRLARTFSNIISPPVIFACLGLALAWADLPFWPGFLWAAVFGFLVSLAPILLVVYLLKTRRITDLHMNTTRERRLPYVSSVGGALMALAILGLFDGPPRLTCLAWLSVVVLSILGLINNFWLISIHAASIAAAATISGLVFGWWAALLVLPLVILVATARLYLKRHTPAQVTGGLALGVGSVLSLTLFGCFV